MEQQIAQPKHPRPLAEHAEIDQQGQLRDRAVETEHVRRAEDSGERRALEPVDMGEIVGQPVAADAWRVERNRERRQNRQARSRRRHGA